MTGHTLRTCTDDIKSRRVWNENPSSFLGRDWSSPIKDVCILVRQIRKQSQKRSGSVQHRRIMRLYSFDLTIFRRSTVRKWDPYPIVGVYIQLYRPTLTRVTFTHLNWVYTIGHIPQLGWQVPTKPQKARSGVLLISRYLFLFYGSTWNLTIFCDPQYLAL